MSTMPTFDSDHYPDGRTKQAFKDSTDINKLLARAAKGETISHLAKHGAIYGDFSDIDDLLIGMQRLEQGNKIFSQLPGEVRREFGQSPSAFFNFVNDPENAERLNELLPALAERGNQFPSITRTSENIDKDPIVKDNPEPEPPPAPEPKSEPEPTP